MNKKILVPVLLLFFSIISVTLTLYKHDFAPPCFNADEAAFSYNAYTLAKTGKDEYGAFLPLRLKSFGDYKMPLYSYLAAIPIGLLGLNEYSGRFINIILAFLFPFVIFALTQELFKNKKVSIVAAGVVSLSLGLHIIARQAHEAYLAAFLISLTTLAFLKLLQKYSLRTALIFCLVLMLSLFSYHSSRIFAVFFFIYTLFTIPRLKKNTTIAAIIFVVLGLFLITDLVYKPERVKNLLFFNEKGFSMQIDELRAEGSSRLLYNKLTVGSRTIAFNYIQYFSPQFLSIDGDQNYRFGYKNMSPVSPLLYIFVFIGLYFSYRNRVRWRNLILLLLLVTPLAASLSWAGISITRSFFMLVPLIVLGSYGIVSGFEQLRSNRLLLGAILVVCVSVELFFQITSWDFYFNHYPKRAIVIRSWQCGNKELAQYIKSSYDKFDTFYITKRNGQPYIMLLFYLQYSPEKYAQQARLSAPDEYGFGQVESFDKFNFKFQVPKTDEKAVLIAYPDEFKDVPDINEATIKKIKIGTEEIFWIYEHTP